MSRQRIHPPALPAAETHDAVVPGWRRQRPDVVVTAIGKLKRHPLFAHIALVWPERSQIATLVPAMLEDYARWNQSSRSVGAGA